MIGHDVAHRELLGADTGRSTRARRTPRVGAPRRSRRAPRAAAGGRSRATTCRYRRRRAWRRGEHQHDAGALARPSSLVVAERRVERRRRPRATDQADGVGDSGQGEARSPIATVSSHAAAPARLRSLSAVERPRGRRSRARSTAVASSSVRASSGTTDPLGREEIPQLHAAWRCDVTSAL